MLSRTDQPKNSEGSENEWQTPLLLIEMLACDRTHRRTTTNMARLICPGKRREIFNSA